MLVNGLHQKPTVGVPYSDGVVSGARDNVKPLRQQILNTGHLVIVALECFETEEFLLFVFLPQLDCHVPGAAGHVVPTGMEAYVVHHARVVPESLFALSCLIVPYFY